MKQAVKKGFSFGLISGIITTLGLIIGLHSSTHSTLVVIGGVLVIAVADALSDALGIHISEEAEGQHSFVEIWQATTMTFVAKFVVALTFIIPFLLFSLNSAIVASLIWGLSLIIIFSYYLSVKQAATATRVVGEHLLIAVIVIIITHYLGDWVATF